jgi:sucrose-6-phosphate hydrolase SacC (GH32 family)
MKLLLVFSVAIFLSLNSFAQVPAQKEEYKKYNPAYHFYPSGDPTGLFYYNGLYYNNWGTASSKDFVHWKLTQATLDRNKAFRSLRDSSIPRAVRDSIQKRQYRLGGSGTIVIDWNNTSGFGKNGEPPLVSLWHNGVAPWSTQVVGIAYSNDTAKTWTRYEKFPVLDINSREFRDPKVFWYEPSKKWIMVIGWAEAPKVKFFSSANLKDWELMSDFGPWGSVNGVWECADFFPLPVDRDPSKMKWVLAISVQPQNAQYFIGDFDGTRFVLDPTYVQALKKDVYLPKGQVLFDFEHGIDDWKMEGNAFVESPAKEALFQQGAIMGYAGKFFVNSFHNRGGGIGKITSPSFNITKNYISFLVAGNHNPGNVGVNLLVDGKAVRTQTGNNSGGMRWKYFDVTEFRGKNAQVEIFDNVNNSEIVVDQIMLTDEPAYTGQENAFWIDYGADFFAVRSWNNYAESENRKIWTAWMGSWRYGGTEPVRGIQTIPRELQLKTFAEGVRLIQNPIKELESLRGAEKKNGEKTVEGSWIPANIQPSQNRYELLVEFENQNAAEFGLQICKGGNQKTTVSYSVTKEELTLDRSNSGLDNFISLFKEVNKGPMKYRSKKIILHVFVDNCSVEVFGNNGETVLSSKIYPDPGSLGIEVFSKQGKVKVNSLRVWELATVDTGLQ